MKKTLLTLSLILAPLATFAGMTVNCDGVSSESSLVLFINNSKIAQVRLQNQGSAPRAFGAQQVSEHSDSALYRLSGLPELMEVEKTVVNGQGGWLRLQGNRYSCDSN